MKKWYIKAIIQKVISLLPLKHKINFLFQRFITKGVTLTDDYFIDRLNHVKNHIHAYNQLTGKNIPSTTLELGTGWYPIVPLSLFIMGSEEIYSIDILSLVDKRRLLKSIERFLEYHFNGQLQKYHDVDLSRIEILKDILKSKSTLKKEEILNKLRVKLLVQDARFLEFGDCRFDLIHSNNTFEHIQPLVLTLIIKEFKRVLKNGGIMSHFIDMSDHFAHFDRSINIYNFLQFSERIWNIIDNCIQPQNRLRIYEYEEIFQQLRIEYEVINKRLGNIEELNKIKINVRFQNKDKDLVAISHCQFVTK